jgi:hypothetical protein
MRRRFRDLASLVALAASGYALYRVWRVDTRLGVALTLLVVGIAVHGMCREPAPPPTLDDAVSTARAIRADAKREAARGGLHTHEKGAPPEWRN